MKIPYTRLNVSHAVRKRRAVTCVYVFFPQTLSGAIEVSNAYDSFKIVAFLSRLVLFDEKVHTTNE